MKYISPLWFMKFCVSKEKTRQVIYGADIYAMAAKKRKFNFSWTHTYSAWAIGLVWSTVCHLHLVCFCVFLFRMWELVQGKQGPSQAVKLSRWKMEAVWMCEAACHQSWSKMLTINKGEVGRAIQCMFVIKLDIFANISITYHTSGITLTSDQLLTINDGIVWIVHEDTMFTKLRQC